MLQEKIALSDFYRATLCVSALFAVSGCLYVCPSRSRIVSTFHTAEDIVKLLSRPCSPRHSSLLWSQAPIPSSKGTPSARALSTRGGLILRLSTEIAIYLGNVYEIGPWNHIWWPLLTSKRVARFVSISWVSCSISCLQSSVRKHIR